MSKLTMEQKVQIIKDHECGMSYRAIARKYAVSRQAIYYTVCPETRRAYRPHSYAVRILQNIVMAESIEQWLKQTTQQSIVTP